MRPLLLHRRPAAGTIPGLGLLLALLLLAARPAASSELDGLAFLSWSPDAVVDTLLVAEAGEHNLWVLVKMDQAPHGFIETVGDWHFGAGIDVLDFEILTTGNPVGGIGPLDRGHALVRIGDFDCRRGYEPDAVARLKLAIDPGKFLGSRAAITPSPTATSLAFAGYDPVLHCVGVWDLALVGPAVALVPSTPTRTTSLGALKARYR